MKWSDVKGTPRPTQPWIKDGSFLGASASICKKHRKIWKEGADFPEACEECCRKANK